jgi:DNA-directed RNA polymerase specialized sigma24 family protein
VLAVHEALKDLEERDPLEAQIVLLRYFTGLTMSETAEVLGIAERTLDRHSRYIRAWLMKRLSLPTEDPETIAWPSLCPLSPR